jgi:hypothetical protein
MTEREGYAALSLAQTGGMSGAGGTGGDVGRDGEVGEPAASRPPSIGSGAGCGRRTRDESQFSATWWR